MDWENREQRASLLARFAVSSLIEEAELTPKPGLVDSCNPGAHTDLNLSLMIQSAQSLYDTFYEIAEVSFQQSPSIRLRQAVGEIGRRGEKTMFQVTNGVNTHKGAIWAMGLLTASAAMQPIPTMDRILLQAGELASFPDKYINNGLTNGNRARERYGVKGAVGEAQAGFPSIRFVAMPSLRKAREENKSETAARIDTLMALIAHVDDTCILHRGGMIALTEAKRLANEVILSGGITTKGGQLAFQRLEQSLLSRNASPGGSADLLAATIFIDLVERNQLYDNMKKTAIEIQ